MLNKNVLVPAKLALLLFVVVLGGCEGMSGFERPPTQPPGVQMAIDLSTQGDHLAASQQYVELANAASDPQQQRFRLFAARELFLANELNRALRMIDDAGQPIANSNLPLWAEVVASIRLAQEDPEAALTALNKVSKAAERSSASRILKLRGETLFALERVQAAVATLVRREALLQTRDEIYDNRQLIWMGLERSTTAISSRSIESATDPVVAGWLELAQIAQRERGSVTQLRKQLLQWQEARASHPANASVLPEFLDELVALSNYPPNVALLLPLSGKQQVLGETIRDGYLTALYSLSEANARPTIRFYDTARNSAAAAYDLAVSNGAAFVVGPLLKPDVNSVAAQVDDVTTLTLNYASEGTDTPASLYQFGLAPEDEARSIARRAIEEGWVNAVALLPDNNWGQRVYNAFATELDQLGGNVLTAQAYPADTPDFSATIRRALLLDESEARRNRLAANIGKQLEYEPRRRQDVDFIFVAANAPTAKLLRPQLRFHYASNVPTFATSSAFIPGSDDNNELDGIMFPDAPWLINPTAAVLQQQDALREIWGGNVDARARFFALGYDAYQLTALLNGRRGRFNLALDGMTGKIGMNRDGQLRRELNFARIKDGNPLPMPAATVDDASAPLPAPSAQTEPQAQPPQSSRSPIRILSPGER